MIQGRAFAYELFEEESWWWRTVYGAAAPDISYPTPQGLVVGAPMSTSPTNTGGASTTWTVDSGALPNGLTLDATTGVISGTPTTVQTTTPTIKAVNAGGSDTFQITFVVSAANANPNPSTPGAAGSPGGPGGVLDQIVKKPGIREVTWNTPGRGVRL